MSSLGKRARAKNQCGRGRQANLLWELTIRIISSVTTAAVLPIIFAPASAADTTAHLKSEIDAARLASGCPALQIDARLNDVSVRVTHETEDYVKHAFTSLPTTGEIDLLATGNGGVLRVMREAGYNTNKAKLLLGYADNRTGGVGDNETKAIKAAVLEGLAFESLTDCGYTKYGLSALNDDSSEGWPSTPPRAFAVTSVVMVGGK